MLFLIFFHARKSGIHLSFISVSGYFKPIFFIGFITPRISGLLAGLGAVDNVNGDYALAADKYRQSLLVYWDAGAFK